MAEQIAQDPAFAQMSAALQASMVNGGAEPGQSASAPPIDPDQYAQAMSSVLQNPQFMEMAEKLGQQIMTVLHQIPGHVSFCMMQMQLYCRYNVIVNSHMQGRFVTLEITPCSFPILPHLLHTPELLIC